MRIQIVSFQVPWPADYGGVIDVAHKLRALHEAGVGVTLHTYAYGGREAGAKELERWCDEVYVYPRQTGLRSQLSLDPYIVNSRRDPLLLERLMADDAPVLLEGLHTCSLLGPLRAAGRTVAVRTHNVEHDYYRGLARNAAPGMKKLFYSVESTRLRRYEGQLAQASVLMAISPDDADYFRRRFPDVAVEYVPPFFDDRAAVVAAAEGVELLYHGNLTVEENIKAVGMIVDSVLPMMKSGARLTVAGRSPSDALRCRVEAAGGRVIADPSDEELESLIRGARVNILITSQATGIKLKLMNVLSRAEGHCLVNRAMVTDPALARICTVAPTCRTIADEADRLLAAPMDAAAASARRGAFLDRFGTAASARRLIEALQKAQNT